MHNKNNNDHSHLTAGFFSVTSSAMCCCLALLMVTATLAKSPSSGQSLPWQDEQGQNLAAPADYIIQLDSPGAAKAPRLAALYGPQKAGKPSRYRH